jgi:ABC-type transporter Mla subunit MlaD
MLGLVFGIIKNIVSKLLFWGFILVIILYFWNTFKAKREARTFTISFNNVDGLSKGAPIYSKGVEVGKVINIFPLGNSNDVGVKGLITKKDFTLKGSDISAKIITDIERGGAKVVEITAVRKSTIGDTSMAGDIDATMKKGNNPYIIKNTLRLMRDFLQLSKDWANDSVKLFNSRDSKEFREDVANNVENTITSLEHGTLKKDVENKISNLNREIKSYERDPNKEKKAKKDLETKVQSLKNTLGSFKTLSDVYKSDKTKN